MNLMENAFRRICRFFPIMLAIVMTVLAAPLHLTTLIAQTPQPGAAPITAVQRPAGGEANLVIPDLTNSTVNVTFFGLSGHTLLMGGLVICALGLLFGLVFLLVNPPSLRRRPKSVCVTEASPLCPHHLTNAS